MAKIRMTICDICKEQILEGQQKVKFQMSFLVHKTCKQALIAALEDPNLKITIEDKRATREQDQPVMVQQDEEDFHQYDGRDLMEKAKAKHNKGKSQSDKLIQTLGRGKQSGWDPESKK